MINLILGNKCVFCNERAKDLDSVGGFGIYCKSREYFHRSCLQEITCDPEHFKHSQVDLGIQIMERLEEQKSKAVYRRKQFKEKCKKLSNYCVEEKK